MVLRWFVASFHLLALGIGLGAIFARARALRALREPVGLRVVFVADNFWGLAALLWIVTGLWRAFGGLEKGTSYYLQHPLFHAKLGLFVAIFVLELRPMASLIRWRRAQRRGTDVNLDRASLFGSISYVQLVLVLLIVFLATALARGMGRLTTPSDPPLSCEFVAIAVAKGG